MTQPYDFERLPSDFIHYVKDLHAYANHEQHSYKLARALKIRVRVALQNSALPNAAAGPVIFLQPWWFAGNNDVTRHELAHVMLWWSGLETQVLHEYGLDTGKRIIERLCNQAIAFLRIPQPLVDQAVKLYGVSARAVRHLMEATQSSCQMAIDRLVFDQPSEARAGFLIAGNYISEIAICNLRLPFWLGHRVPEPQIVLPEASLLRLPHGGGLLGVLTGGNKEQWYWDGA